MASHPSHTLQKKHQLLLADFERVERDYADHRQEIFNKFVAIMRDRVQQHSKTIKSWDYADEATTSPSPALQMLMKETTTIHKVLAQVLPVEQIKTIFANIFTMYQMRLFVDLAPLYSNLSPLAKKRYDFLPV